MWFKHIKYKTKGYRIKYIYCGKDDDYYYYTYIVEKDINQDWIPIGHFKNLADALTCIEKKLEYLAI